MDLRLAVYEFVKQGNDLLERLRSPEGDMLSRTDLHVLEVQLYLLDKEVTKKKQTKPPPRAQSPPPFPPFDSSNKDSGT